MQLPANRSSAQVGYWAALGSSVTFIVYTACFVLILASAPIFTWTNLQDYVAYTNAHNQTWKFVAQVDMLLFGVFYVVMLNAIYDNATATNKSTTRLGLLFGAMFALLVCSHYFVQISSVRLSVIKGQTDGLLQFIQANPYGGLAAMNMLGWTLFLGLSSLFVAPVFRNGRLEKLLHIAFIANGIFCLVGGIAYVLEITLLIFVCTTLGMGASVIVIAVALCFWFKRIRQNH